VPAKGRPIIGVLAWSSCSRPQETAKIRLDNPDFACEVQAAWHTVVCHLYGTDAFRSRSDL